MDVEKIIDMGKRGHTDEECVSCHNPCGGFVGYPTKSSGPHCIKCYTEKSRRGG